MSTDAQVWIAGRRVRPDEAKVSVFDRGFLYGDSVFETLRTYGGRPFALREHVRRLAQSAARVFIDLPVGVDALETEIRRAVEESQFDECYVRVMVTRGVAALGLDPVASHHPERVFILAPLHPPPREDYLNGIKAVTFASSRPADNTGAAGAKIGNYLVAVLAQKRAREAGAKEALIVTPENTVLEGATSNVFWIEGGQLWTVPTSAGILEGITRAHIISTARRLGWSVHERIPELSTLLAAEAVFVSSSIRELLSVVAIDDHVVGTGSVSPQVTELHAEFRRSAGVEPVC